MVNATPTIALMRVHQFNGPKEKIQEMPTDAQV